MEFDIEKLTLIDLISEKHACLRKTLEQRWEAQSEKRFSHAELHLLARIEQQNLTISKAASVVGISRQAMQKSVTKLEAQGYISTEFRDGNQRDKFLSLTKSGKEFCRKNNRLKTELEEELEKNLGSDEVRRLKELFKQNWLTD